MLRRRFPVLLAAGVALARSAEHPVSPLTGNLRTGGWPALRTEDGKQIRLTGDATTLAVLGDARLAGARVEAHGEFQAPDLFRIGPIHKRSLMVHQNGKKLLVSYWCDVCSIRTYAPGPCLCCQDETELDLRESIEP